MEPILTGIKLLTGSLGHPLFMWINGILQLEKHQGHISNTHHKNCLIIAMGLNYEILHELGV